MAVILKERGRQLIENGSAEEGETVSEGGKEGERTEEESADTHMEDDAKEPENLCPLNIQNKKHKN